MRLVKLDMLEIHSDPSACSTHKILLRILRGDVALASVEELDCGDECVTEGESYRRCSPDSLQLTHEDIDMIRQAINVSPWIHQTEKQQYLDGILNGNEDMVLCILIPLLTNLRWLLPPLNTVRLHQIVGRIASAYHNVGIEGQEVEAAVSLPLNKLVYVSPGAFNGTVGMDLETAAYYAALPSLQRLILQASRDDRFSVWPDSLPQSRLSEIYFEDSTVTSSAVQAFAKGLAAPCVIRQSFSTYGHECPSSEGGNLWDHYWVGGEIDPMGLIKDGRWEKIELKYDNEYYGYASNHKRDSEFSDGFNDFLEYNLVGWESLTSS